MSYVRSYVSRRYSLDAQNVREYLQAVDNHFNANSLFAQKKPSRRRAPAGTERGIVLDGSREVYGGLKASAGCEAADAPEQHVALSGKHDLSARLDTFNQSMDELKAYLSLDCSEQVEELQRFVTRLGGLVDVYATVDAPGRVATIVVQLGGTTRLKCGAAIRNALLVQMRALHIGRKLEFSVSFRHNNVLTLIGIRGVSVTLRALGADQMVRPTEMTLCRDSAGQPIFRAMVGSPLRVDGKTAGRSVLIELPLVGKADASVDTDCSPEVKRKEALEFRRKWVTHWQHRGQPCGERLTARAPLGFWLVNTLNYVFAR
jgi:hypothetical protein